jgi:hypothetical protein
MLRGPSRQGGDSLMLPIGGIAIGRPASLIPPSKLPIRPRSASLACRNDKVGWVGRCDVHRSSALFAAGCFAVTPRRKPQQSNKAAPHHVDVAESRG